MRQVRVAVVAVVAGHGSNDLCARAAPDCRRPRSLARSPRRAGCHSCAGGASGDREWRRGGAARLDRAAARRRAGGGGRGAARRRRRAGGQKSGACCTGARTLSPAPLRLPAPSSSSRLLPHGGPQGRHQVCRHGGRHAGGRGRVRGDGARVAGMGDGGGGRDLPRPPRAVGARVARPWGGEVGTGALSEAANAPAPTTILLFRFSPPPSALQAIDKYTVEKDIAAYVKREFDKRHSPTWHCVVGRNFGARGGGGRSRARAQRRWRPPTLLLLPPQARTSPTRPSISSISTWATLRCSCSSRGEGEGARGGAGARVSRGRARHGARAAATPSHIAAV